MSIWKYLLMVIFACAGTFSHETRAQSASESLEQAFYLLTNAPNPNIAWEQPEIGPVLKSVADRPTDTSEYRTALLMYGRWLSETYLETADKDSLQVYGRLASEPKYSWQREVAKCAIAGVQFNIDWPAKWKAANDAFKTIQWDKLEKEKDTWFHRFSNIYPNEIPLVVEMKDGLHAELAKVYVHSNKLSEANVFLEKVQDSELRSLITRSVDYQNLLKQSYSNAPPASQSAPASPKSTSWTLLITALLIGVGAVCVIVFQRKR